MIICAKCDGKGYIGHDPCPVCDGMGGAWDKEDLATMRSRLMGYHERQGTTPTPTCDGCAIITKCKFAYDAYNTMGDCLMDH